MVTLLTVMLTLVRGSRADTGSRRRASSVAPKPATWGIITITQR